MICQNCETRPASLHFTKFINGEKTEIHLCEQCAKENGESLMFQGNSGFSINNLLAGLINLESSFSKSTKQQTYSNKEVLQCPHCKMTYHKFAKLGKFGCAECYKTFENSLTPFLKRLHGGNYVHNGKVPKRIGGNIHLKKELEAMKLNLKEYIAQEEFEKAAELRDQIRAFEKRIQEGKKGDEM
ncbi:UvrB/UvrC motif-containing protein [Priestia koreensis]|uniref:UVR domain-containing protein n=1 Tax=Priestia koreensis TaxID=284581 RepID=A0A0M0KQE1_9BACI|nr:UvrB/UvrC motif-containing protein [Priestia koreensis]KOO40837.1 hypothetical protein AMD01_20120 [Priestia koreensis]